MKANKKTVSELADETRQKYFPMKYKEYLIERTDAETFYKELGKIFSKVFPTGSGYRPSKKEVAGLVYCSNEYKKLHSEKFLIKHKGKVIGWFQGEMDDFETFYMRNTGILPAYQNKGIYKEFLKKFEKYIFKLGYTRISSQHSPTNATVLSLKLKAGFVVVGQETHERWGVLVKLVKFSSKKRRDYYIKKVD